MIEWCKRRTNLEKGLGKTAITKDQNEEYLHCMFSRRAQNRMPQQARNSYSSHDIIDVAGELDDRWLRDEESGLKPGTTRARREESPDTALRQQGNGQRAW